MTDTEPRDDLAAALHAGGIGPTSVDGHWLCQGVEHHGSDAAFVLATLDARSNPVALRAAFDGAQEVILAVSTERDALRAEVERLRAIEGAAREYLSAREAWLTGGDDNGFLMDEARDRLALLGERP